MAVQTTQSGIQDKVNGLYPTWITVVATIVAVLILLLVLTKLFYKPIKKNFEDRRNYIQNNINEAENQNKKASLDREKANEELINARINAVSIVSEAKIDAERIRINEILKAKKDASDLIKSAKTDMEIEKSKFAIESKKAIVEVAIEAATKIVEKEVDNKINRKIVEDFIKTK